VAGRANCEHIKLTLRLTGRKPKIVENGEGNSSTHFTWRATRASVTFELSTRVPTAAR